MKRIKKRIRAPTAEMRSPSDYTEYETNPAYVVTGGTPEAGVDYGDVTGVTTSGGSATNDFQVEITSDTAASSGVESSDASIATVTGDGLVKTINYVSDGNAEISVYAGDLRTAKLNYNAGSVTAPKTYEVTAYDSGSLAEHVHDTVTALINTKTPTTTTQNVFSSYSAADFDNPVAVRNTSLFIADYDLTGVSMMRDDLSFSLGYRYPCQLITSRHALTATHVISGGLASYFIGRKYKFMDSLGGFQTVTVVDAVEVSADLTVILFDADLTNCAIYSVMSEAQYESYLPSMMNWTLDGAYETHYYGHDAVPLVRTSPWDMSLAADDNSLIKAMYTTRAYGFGEYLSKLALYQDLSYTVAGDIPDWVSDMKGGDSGCAFFMTIDNGTPELVLVGNAFGGSMNCPSGNTALINTAMNTMAGVAQGTYALTHPDLSAFNSY